MECGRRMVYFSVYEEENKKRSAGYMSAFFRGQSCEVQLYYRALPEEEGVKLQPVYMFSDGAVVLGNEIFVEEGMAAVSFRTSVRDFLQSGHTLDELELVWLDGVRQGICGGRVDGRGQKGIIAPEALCLEQRGVKPKESPADRRLLPGGSRCCRRRPDFRNP